MEPAAAEELDQVVSMLGDMDIEVEGVEETALAEDTTEKAAAEPDWTEEPAEAEEVERAPGETADPVRMYLQEMGGVPLLTREEEVAIAKEIEAGEREVREAVFSLDLAVQYVLGLADRLKRGEIEARHVFGDDETPTDRRAATPPRAGPREDKRADGFLKQVAKLRRLVGEREKLEAERGKARTSKTRKAAIAKRLEVIAQSVRETLLETKIGAKHVTSLVETLEGGARHGRPRAARRAPARGAARPPEHRGRAACRPDQGRGEGRATDRQPHVPRARGAGARGRRDHQGGAPAHQAGDGGRRHAARARCATCCASSAAARPRRRRASGVSSRPTSASWSRSPSATPTAASGSST